MVSDQDLQSYLLQGVDLVSDRHPSIDLTQIAQRLFEQCWVYPDRGMKTNQFAAHWGSPPKSSARPAQPIFSAHTGPIPASRHFDFKVALQTQQTPVSWP